MKRQMRTYYYAIFGAIGGLVGWQTSNVLGLSFVSNLFVSEGIVGALVGLSIGLLVGITEGILTLNIIQVLKSGLFSGLLGAVAGAIGLPLGEFLFQKLGAGLFGRAMGWSLFGMLLGLAQGVIGRSQAWKGMLGGLLGGALGGALLEISHRYVANPLTAKLVGLILLGASVGAFISLIVTLLSRAWLEVTSGKLKGTEFILDKFMRKGFPSIAVGSSALKSEIVLPDPDIAPQHAMLTSNGARFTLKDISLSGTFVNKKRIEQAVLANRQSIRMGNTQLVYHEKR
jgi:hypothetical protein